MKRSLTPYNRIIRKRRIRRFRNVLLFGIFAALFYLFLAKPNATMVSSTAGYTSQKISNK
ncbi:MAG: hypothetical protein ABIN57_08290 [Chitinophagaceae bacterium]